MVHTGAATGSEASKVAESEPASQGQEGRRLVTFSTWAPDKKDDGQTDGLVEEMPFVSRVTAGGAMDSGNGVVDVDRLRYHCSTGILVPRGEAHGEVMLRTVLGCVSRIFILGEVLWARPGTLL